MEPNFAQRAADRLAHDWRLHALLLLPLVGFAAVAWYANAGRDLWLDEVITVEWAYSPLDKIHVIAGSDRHAALYFWLMHFWVKGGDSELWLRTPTLIVFLTTLPVVYGIGRIIQSPLTGLVAAALFVTSPYMIYFAGEARPYTLLVFLASANFLCLTHLVLTHRSGITTYPFVVSLRHALDPRARTDILKQNLLWAGVVAFTFLLMITHLSATVVPLAIVLA